MLHQQWKTYFGILPVAFHSKGLVIISVGASCFEIFPKVHVHMKAIPALSWDYPKGSFQLQVPII